MKLTKEWLEENNACNSGKEWFANQKEVELGKITVKQSEKKDQMKEAPAAPENKKAGGSNFKSGNVRKVGTY